MDDGRDDILPGRMAADTGRGSVVKAVQRWVPDTARKGTRERIVSIELYYCNKAAEASVFGGWWWMLKVKGERLMDEND